MPAFKSYFDKHRIQIKEVKWTESTNKSLESTYYELRIYRDNREPTDRQVQKLSSSLLMHMHFIVTYSSNILFLIVLLVFLWLFLVQPLSYLSFSIYLSFSVSVQSWASEYKLMDIPMLHKLPGWFK